MRWLTSFNTFLAIKNEVKLHTRIFAGFCIGKRAFRPTCAARCEGGRSVCRLDQNMND